MKKKCLTCDLPLSPRQEKRGSECCSRSCSNLHRYRDIKRDFLCQMCGKSYIKKGRGKSGTKYCSTKCGRRSNLGKSFTREHKRKIAEGQKGVRVDGDVNCDRCNRVFDSNTSVRAHKAHCGKNKKMYRCFNCDKKYRGLAGLQRHQIWCIDSEENINSRKKVKECSRASNIRRLKDENSTMPCKDTKPELELEWALNQAGVDYMKQFDGVSGQSHCYDFIIGEKLIVEVDGDYWHGNKDRFELSDRQKRQYRIDQNYTSKARIDGFTVLRYWESLIMTESQAIVDDIIRVSNGDISKLSRGM